MGMFRCPTCSREISDQAAACPGCGHQLKTTGFSLADPVHLLGVILLIVFLAGVLIYACNKGRL